MGPELAVVLALLAAAIVMFAINRPRMDAVALIMLVALPFTGVMTMGEALAGFADPNIVLIAALFVIGDGLVRTGVARRLGDWLAQRSGGNETKLVVLLMVVVCGLGATMSSTAVTAIFIPVALRIAHGSGASPSRLMMPLSMAALISGMTTLVATAPNLVVNSELVNFLERQGEKDPSGFHFFSFAPFGAPILALGIVYMLFARRWLPDRSGDSSQKKAAGPSLAGWIEEYKLSEREHRVRVLAESPFVGQTIEELSKYATAGSTVVAIERGSSLLQPTSQTRLQAGDNLLVDSWLSGEQAEAIRQQFRLEAIPLSGAYFSDKAQEIGMVEAIVPASSELIGLTITDARVRDRFGLTAIGLKRGAKAFEGELKSEVLNIGDSLLLIGPWRAIENAGNSGRHLVPLDLPAEHAEVLPVAGRAPHALACLILVVGLMVSGVVPNVQAALIGCLLMGALGCINLTSAYRSIDWKTIVLIVGMLPFSEALKRTGGVDLASDALVAATGGLGPRGILAALFIITAALGMFISNTATAVLMAPVALSIAKELGASPYPFAMIVALAASTAFMTPVSSPVNTLVVTPGNYTFGDFLKIGTPFALIVLIVCVILVPWLLPL